jgi:hypothetical protein
MGINDLPEDDKLAGQWGDGLKIYESNCHKLLELLGKDETWEKLMSAEIYRNLGNFIESNTILDTINDEEYNWIKVQLKQECERKNKDVIELELLQ